MQLKLSILGSCVSEDWVHYRDIESDDLALAERRHHSSLISVCAKPVAAPEDLGPDLNEWEAQQLRRDLDKSVLPHLATVKPDGLIIDLAIDSLRGIAMLDGGLITNSYMFQNSRLFENFDERNTYAALREPEAYSRVFGSATEQFRAFMERHLPGCRVILHKCRYALCYRDRSGQVRAFPEDVQRAYRRANDSMARLEAIIESQMPCDVIAIADDTLLADEKHVWGLGGMHLERSYYGRFQADLARIMRR